MSERKLEPVPGEVIMYEDYVGLVDRFNQLYHQGFNNVTVNLDAKDLRLVYLSLMTTKARMKDYDPKKGLNQ